MKSHITKIITLIIIVALVVSLSVVFVSCDKNKAKQVPVYQGMTISRTTSNVYNSPKTTELVEIMPNYDGDDIENVDPHEDEDDLDADVEDLVTIEVHGDEDVKYYVRPNETFIIEVHISNPNDYEIQSFTLNGKKYANYMFKDGSTMELLLLEVTAPSTPGYVEYTIDAIKYIDGTEIKDVDMRSGNKSIKAGIAYTSVPTATVTSQAIDTTAFTLNINVSDPQSVIGDNAIKIYLTDGESIIAEKALSVGANTVTFDGLTMSKTYGYGVATTYDLVDGRDARVAWLLENTITTAGAFSFATVVPTKTSVSFDVTRTGSVGTIDSITVYDATTKALVASGNAETRLFDNLLSNHAYNLYVDFSYTVGGETKTDWAVAHFATLAKVTPTVEIASVVPTQTSFAYAINVTDTDQVGAITKIELLHGNDAPVEVQDLTSRVFADLLSNNAYTVRVTYTYNLNDGVGAQTLVETVETRTLAKAMPTLAVGSIVPTQTSFEYAINVTDEDQVGTITKIELLHGNDAPVEVQDLTSRAFADLLSNNAYTVRVTYTYNLNDGVGAQTLVEAADTTTVAKAVPSVAISSDNVTEDTITATLTMTDEDNVGTIVSVQLFKGENLVATNAQNEINFTGLDAYTDYKVVVNYSYNLNDGAGVHNAKVEKEYKTSPHLEFTNCRVVNTSAVSEGETIYMQVSLANPSGAMPKSVVVNGRSYNCTSSTTTSKIYVEIVYDGQFDGGDTELTVERVNMTLGGKDYAVEPTTNNSDNVFINGKLELLDVYLCDALGNKKDVPFVFESETVYCEFEFDNKTGYTIDSIDIQHGGPTTINDLVKIDNNHWVATFAGISSINEYGQHSVGITNVSYSNESINKELQSTSQIYITRVMGNEPIVVTTKEEFPKTGYHCYSLQNDIDFSGVEWKETGDLHGVLLGNNHTISNISFIGTFQDTAVRTGLYRHVNGTVADLNISNATFIINVKSNNGQKYNCEVGGICGYLSNGGSIINCSVDSESFIMVSGDIAFGVVGGIVGNAFGTISECSNYATLNCNVESTGGIAGETNNGLVKDCNNYGDVAGIENVGGIVGYNYGGTQCVRCENSGYIYGQSYVGGIVGYNFDITSIYECVNSGTIEGDYSVAGICAYSLYDITFVKCKNEGEIRSASQGGGIIAECYRDVSLVDCIDTGEVIIVNE